VPGRILVRIPCRILRTDTLGRSGTGHANEPWAHVETLKPTAEHRSIIAA